MNVLNIIFCGLGVVLSVSNGGLIDLLLFFFSPMFGCGCCDEYYE